MSMKTKATRTLPRDRSLDVWYRKRLLRHVKAMSRNTESHIKRAWPEPSVTMARDAGAARSLADILRSLKYNWKNQFSRIAEEVAHEFARRAEKSTSGHLKNLLKEVGFGVTFRETRDVQNMLQAIVAENVSLIKSIHGVYFTQVETLVMQGVKNGRDLGYIARELQERYGITERKATIIARDQTNKATGAISRARCREAGLRRATWTHIGGKKTDRSTHEAMDGKEFDLEFGMHDPAVGRNVMPGELINCNCKYRIIVPDVESEGGVPLSAGVNTNLTTKRPKNQEGHALKVKRDAVRNAILKINKGAHEATVKNLRNDLEQFGGTNNVTFIRGNKKKGLEHIIQNGREHYLGAILDTVIEGRIDKEYTPRGGEKVRLILGKYRAILVLEDKTWLLTGWDETSDPAEEKAAHGKKELAKDANGQWHTKPNLRTQDIFHSSSVGAFASKSCTSDRKARSVQASSLRKRGLFHSARLGADASLADIVRNWKMKSRKNP